MKLWANKNEVLSGEYMNEMTNALGGKKICPRCHDIWVYCSDMDRFQWKMNCHCGYAWGKSEWKDTRDEAVEAWNEFIVKEFGL